MPAMVRDGDSTTTGHGCDAVTTVTGPTGASSNVHANGIDVETETNPTSPHTIPGGGGCVPHSAVINVGSPNVFTGGLAIARLGDSTDGGALISGSPNVFVNSAAATTEAMGWDEIALPPAEAEVVFAAINEETNEFIGAAANPEPTSNEFGEYGDGHLTSERNATSPTTGEEGTLTVEETSSSTYPEYTGELLNFLPHTDSRIKDELKTILEAIATQLGTTLTMTSAYRSPDYNKRVGGAKTSQHMLGNAVDVVQTEFSQQGRIDFIQACIDNGIQGIGIYNSFTHVDIGGKRCWGPTGSRKSLPQVSWAISTLQSAGYST